MRGPEMEGFDPKWRDVADFINGITFEIWEGRQIADLKTYYADGLIVRSPASIVQGNDGIIAATLATLAQFPDRELPGEDVIWCPAEKGFLSSHRLICRGTADFGQPTARKVEYRILADCYCQENAVHDEWLVRDQTAIARQLGWLPQDWVRHQITQEGGPEACVKPYRPETDIAGPYQGRGNTDQWGQRLSEILQNMMKADFSTVPKSYDRSSMLHYPGHVVGHGHKDADRFWLGLRAALPSAEFTIHHQIGRDDTRLPPRAAVRWSLAGRHDGAGRFGPASGAPLHVMGITHAEFGPNGLRREWTLIDDTAVWRQILLSTGSC